MQKNQRLTAYLRNAIATNMTEARFRALDTVDAVNERAVIAAYIEQQVPERIANLWFNGSDSEKAFLDTSCSYLYALDADNTGGERIDVDCDSYHPIGDKRTSNIVTVPHKLYAQLEKAVKDRERAQAQKRKLEGILAGCTTVKQFLEVFPAAAKYVPDLNTPAGEIVAVEELQRIEAEFLTRDFAIKEADGK